MSQTYTCTHPFALFLGGAEVPYWRSRLTEASARHVSINFMQLRKERMPKNGQWAVADKFSDTTEVLADGGGYSAKLETDHEDHLSAYLTWVRANIDRLSLVVEYDPKGLGAEWSEDRRELYEFVPPTKFLPVWHEEHGRAVLETLCNDHERVAITAPSAGVASLLRPLVARTAVKLHGLAITNLDDIMALSLTTAGSLSWISPSRYGETQVWAGGRLHWYPKKSQGDARERHHYDIEQSGFDADAYRAGDKKEVARYTAWAWGQYEQDVIASRGYVDAEVVDLTGRVDPERNRSTEGGSVDLDGGGILKSELVLRETKEVFPGLRQELIKLEEPLEDGQQSVIVPVIQESDLRRCNNCSLSRKCPKYAPGHACAFHFPVQIRNKTQLDASLSTVLEAMMRRLAFALVVEEAEGVMSNPDVTDLMKSYLVMVSKVRDIQSDTSLFRVEARGPAAGGLITALLGAAAGKEAQHRREAISPRRADEVLADLVVDMDPLDEG